ncbi:MAG: peptidoglycan editing factor PgeF [Spirochaetes bacterium]|nr:peptidoglycan editing factor PgeF [Spirochaetota bacterium]
MINLVKDSQHIYRIYGLCGLQAGIIAKAANRVDYNSTMVEIRSNEKMLIYKATGILPEHIVMLDQVHGCDIVEIYQHPRIDEPFVAKADGFLTMVHGVCLVIRTADCVPVILFDAENGVVAALHSGWRGCAQNITREGIQLMIKKGSRPESLYVLILPSIGPQSYEIGQDVASQFDGYVIKRDGRLYLNMWQHIKDSALQCGIPDLHIFISNLCTFQNNNDFFSHRRGDKGRNLNFVYLS